MIENLFAAEDLEPPGRGPEHVRSLNVEISPKQAPPRLRSVISHPATRGLPENPKTQAFRKKYFPDATDADWNNWHWQIRHRITSGAGLERLLRLSDAERAALSAPSEALPVAVTPFYASLLDEDAPDQALRRTVIPRPGELLRSPGEAEDPLGEEHDSPVPGLVHRYPDRVLFLATEYCSTYCRYCTRSRMVGKPRKQNFHQRQWDRAIDYIAATPAVRDVLISGGDPLTLSDARLEYLLSRLRQIPHVEILRIGTKVPAVLPQRITFALTRMLKRHHPLWMSIHFTHPDELTSEVREACARLSDAGVPLGSQTVLLAGVNDEAAIQKRLMQGLLRTRVRPYYLYQCDPILGSAHFRTPVEKGLEIIEGLRGHTSGYAVPTYVIDAPGGGGKIPLLPDYVAGRRNNELLLRNYTGGVYGYPDAGACPAAGTNGKMTAACARDNGRDAS